MTWYWTVCGSVRSVLSFQGITSERTTFLSVWADLCEPHIIWSVILIFTGDLLGWLIQVLFDNSRLYCTYSYLCFCHIHMLHEGYETHSNDLHCKLLIIQAVCKTDHNLHVNSYINSPGRDEIALIYGAHPPFGSTSTLDLSVPVRGAVEEGGLQPPTRVNTIHPLPCTSHTCACSNSCVGMPTHEGCFILFGFGQEFSFQCISN